MASGSTKRREPRGRETDSSARKPAAYSAVRLALPGFNRRLHNTGSFPDAQAYSVSAVFPTVGMDKLAAPGICKSLSPPGVKKDFSNTLSVRYRRERLPFPHKSPHPVLVQVGGFPELGLHFHRQFRQHQELPNPRSAHPHVFSERLMCPSHVASQQVP